MTRVHEGGLGDVKMEHAAKLILLERETQLIGGLAHPSNLGV